MLKDENDYEMKCLFFPQAAFTDYFALTGTLGMKHHYSVLTAYLSSELPDIVTRHPLTQQSN